MRELVIEVPVASVVPVDAAAAAALFDALFGARRAPGGGTASWALNEGGLAVHATCGSTLTMRAPGPESVPLRVEASGEPASVVPGLGRLEATNPGLLRTFLEGQLVELDHIGVNLAASEIGEPGWKAFLAELDRSWPVHVLDLPGTDCVAIALADPRGHDPAKRAVQALEIVHDRRARHSSLHVCVRVATDRAATERAFPAPCGACKPGDEAFFRSVTVATGVAVPFYLDLAFADAPFPRWSEIVAQMGRRWH
jgi:hypothetical protein